MRTVAGKFYRLIPSRFPPVDVYERLGHPSLSAAAQDAEALTNPRLSSLARSQAVQGALLSKEPRYQNWNHAPFAYLNPEGTWLLPAAYGALELTFEPEAALLLAIFRRERFLSRTREAPIDLDMRLLVTEVDGEFVDLLAEPPTNREQRWETGETLRKHGRAGAIHRRDEVPGGTFLSIFTGAVVGRSVQAAHYRFVWNGEQVRSVYDFAGRTLDRESLTGRLSAPQVA